MSRIALLLLFVAGSIFVGAQGDTFGKSEAQILAMGIDKWDDFYGKKAGTSTADMSAMNEIFGTAALHRNEKLSKHASPSTQARVKKLRKLMSDFGGNAVDIGYNIDGGGTIWTPVSASINAHMELVLYTLLGGKGERETHVSVAMVKKQFGVLEATIMSTHKDKSAAGYFKYDDAKASLAKLRAEFAQIVLVAKGLSPTEINRIYSYCNGYAKTAKGDWT